MNSNNILQKKLMNSFEKYEGLIAIRHGIKKITYKELNQKTNFLAQKIYIHLLGSEKKIAILLDSTLLLIEYIIAILKNRCIFIPINYDYPIMKINEMLEDVNVDLIITDYEKKECLSENLKGKCLVYNDKNNCVLKNNYERAFFENEAQGDDDIYIYFTSGSTGKSKAIKGRNSSLTQFLQWEIETYELYGYNFAQLTNPSFDPFLREIFVPLLSGGTIILRKNKNLFFSPKLFKKWIEEEQIDVIHSTPCLINSFSRNVRGKVRGVKYIFSAGQKIYSDDVQLWDKVFSEETCFVNLYGPTEATLAKCYYEIDRKSILGDIIPVGKPI